MRAHTFELFHIAKQRHNRLSTTNTIATTTNRTTTAATRNRIGAYKSSETNQHMCSRHTNTSNIHSSIVLFLHVLIFVIDNQFFFNFGTRCFVEFSGVVIAPNTESIYSCQCFIWNFIFFGSHLQINFTRSPICFCAKLPHFFLFHLVTNQ